jgi:hypothetical protein
LVQLNQNQLSSTLPSELGRLVNLQHLLLMDNRLQGTIPPSWGSMTSLMRLSVSHNSLQGPLPIELGLLTTNMEFLELDHNSFEGCIPSEWGTMTKIRSLLVGHNNLTCGVPSELGLLSFLEWLDVSYNSRLQGILPVQLFGMSTATPHVLTVDFRGTNVSVPTGDLLCCSLFDGEDVAADCPCTVIVTNGTVMVESTNGTMTNQTAGIGMVARNETKAEQPANIFRFHFDKPMGEQKPEEEDLR